MRVVQAQVTVTRQQLLAVPRGVGVEAGPGLELDDVGAGPLDVALAALVVHPVGATLAGQPHVLGCVELDDVDGRAGSLDRLDIFSDEHDDLAAALYADAYPVDSDREGRIVLPELLTEHAGLQDAVMFMGAGRTFQMWEPAAGKQHQAGVRERARERGLTLPGRVPGAPARGPVQ